MDASPTPDFKPTLFEGRFGGRTEFAELVRAALVRAADEGWREMIWCDADFDDWPLGESAVTSALQSWGHTGRKLTMLAKNYDVLVRRHARFVTWRQKFSHLVECRIAGGGLSEVLPSALWSPGWILERLNAAHCTGFAGSQTIRRVELKERLKERLLKSAPGFAATTLGL